MKICQIINSASHYRENIFSLIDREFDCDFVFGVSLSDIKQMDISKFRGIVTKVRNRFFTKGFYWQEGVQRFLNNKYDAYILIGDAHCLSIWLFCIRAKITGRSKRIFFWTHGWYGKETKIERWIKKRFFRLAGGGIFLYGNYARGLMIKEGFSPEKLWVIHNSLDYDKQLLLRKSNLQSDVYLEHFGNSKKVIIFIGRLTAVKHLDMLVNALPQIKEKCNLIFVGEGGERKRLEHLVSENGLEDRVWFYGPCYDERINAELIYNADLCVAPGNVGLTAIHSLMFGTPVISHNDFKWQMPEFEAIIPQRTGVFFEHNNLKSLINTIQKWFDCHTNRNETRQFCFNEIDANWNPDFQIKVFKAALNKVHHIYK